MPALTFALQTWHPLNTHLSLFVALERFDLASVAQFAELSQFPDKWEQVMGAEVIPATKK